MTVVHTVNKQSQHLMEILDVEIAICVCGFYDWCCETQTVLKYVFTNVTSFYFI